ncbi:NADH-quinone oxidoreductase subunit NuoF [Desulfosporosinus sp.]|uniref:NADH-quinone oxidoreductase subunit NuoF n=1 Tax=Desulfosporosinus sp. TaxID=157907 RepID=UPI000E985329|nr:NADH-quinone oxidoreductase subunit NuoF [Desulfosporosinus sp.]MBC2721432.1 NADH-quinone oxidoreductase subunit NuoF [Desulfosporosinus sp.]MBC2727488.1 NADH-quinone oxidoreductase subunit NuoF [Desulfosporosinus sp.]HBV87718.1 NADH-quinone oxidoreductase subunit F [Desulfosporosinus sp.]
MKLINIDALKALQAQSLKLLESRRVAEAITTKNAQGHVRHVMVCGGPGCHSSGSPRIAEVLEEELNRRGLSDTIKVFEPGCFGFCEKGPMIEIFPDKVTYCEVSADDVTTIVEEHFIKGNVIEHLLFMDPNTKERFATNIPFYDGQLRIALRNVGSIAPENILEYIAADGYQALSKVLFSMKPFEVIDVLKQSGLRGRGGAGFPTGVKWELTRKSEADQRYIICNADEGDPGAFMDRSVLEGDPHSVLEAMLIAGATIGASEGFIYVRAEYPAAIHRLKIAIAQARDFGLLGKEILGSDFSFDIELKLGAGAFVCGEETALIHSIEGARGEPSVKPPFPAQKGLWGKPTCVNNVETLANIPPIILNGAEWFSAIGTEKSKGTKVFALAGKVNNVGLVEVPMGTTLRQIIFDIGGGIKQRKTFKAAQTGGPSGGCIPTKYLDSPIDYESLASIGSMMGSGGLIVLDEDDCMVNIAKFFQEFTMDESCGRCTACRVGTKRLYEILTKITEGKATLEDLDNLEKLCHIIKDTALCGLGQSAPNPILSTLKYFREEYIAHVVDKNCPAGVCSHLLKYEITDKCVGCTLCVKKCPMHCITGTTKKRHVIDQERCLKCGACMDQCRVIGAIIRH